MMAGTDGAAAPDTAARFARMLQFGDSMFPIGGFSFSCGLESAVQTGVVNDRATLHAFARTALEQAARGDGIALIAAHRAAVADDVEALIAIDRQVLARKPSDETRTMSTRMGRKFTEIGVEVVGAPLIRTWLARIAEGATPGCYPVALAVNFAAQGLSAREAFLVHHYGVATAILGAALRLMRMSHVDTQAILYDLNVGVDAAYETASAAQLSDMAGFAPLSDILAAVHTKAHVRLFMN
jgi:urease accessory protein